MKPAGHVLCTFTISGLVFFIFKSRVAFFASLIAGILIDIDHIFDYYLQQGPTLRMENIYRWCKGRKFEFVFLVFHSIELVFLLWMIISLFKLGIYWIAFAIGITQHLILDILFNPVCNYTYFFSYRVIRGFKREYLFRDNLTAES